MTTAYGGGSLAKRLARAPLSLADALRLIGNANEDLSRISENRLPVEFIEKGLTQSLTEFTKQLNLQII